MSGRRKDAYARAGVDLGVAGEAVDIYRAIASRTPGEGVVGGIGHFAGLFADPGDPDTLLAAGADGVGTKLLLAREADRLEGVGIDAVAMVVNDLLAVGARPLFLLDYLATDRLSAAEAKRIVGGVAEGCAMAGCALLGGETAELPGLITTGAFDLAAFAVGSVSRRRLVSGEAILPGDLVLALGASGLHANGFSLVRRILSSNGISIHDSHPEVGSWADALLCPTRIYAGSILASLGDEVHGLCHVTGGGIAGNLLRILPQGTCAILRRDALRPDAATRALMGMGALTTDDVLPVWNLGVGFVVIADADVAGRVAGRLAEHGETVWELGEIGQGGGITWR